MFYYKQFYVCALVGFLINCLYEMHCATIKIHDVTFLKTVIFIVTHASTPILTLICVLQGSKLIYVK
jgi:hypothetical protein